MIFVFLTFLSAFFIESIGTYTSIIGLSLLFSSNPVIIALALALDMGKLITVSFLYKHWKKMHIIMRSYMLVAASILMIITSAGAAGYLSAEFQGAILNTKESDIRVSALKEEKVKLELRKKEIDSQIANLPPNMVKGRTKLINEFKAEITRVNDRVVEIDKALPELEVAKAGADAHAGPILYIAKAFDISVEEAVKWVILLIIFVFDPLAIVLIIGGNFLVDIRKVEKDKEEKDAKKREEDERHRLHQIELDEIKHRHTIEEERVEIEKLHVPMAAAAIVAAPVIAATHEVDQFEEVHEEVHQPVTPAFAESVELEQPHVIEPEVVADIQPDSEQKGSEIEEEAQIVEETEAETEASEEAVVNDGVCEADANDSLQTDSELSDEDGVMSEPEPEVQTDDQLDLVLEHDINHIPISHTLSGINANQGDVEMDWSGDEHASSLKIYNNLHVHPSL